MSIIEGLAREVAGGLVSGDFLRKAGRGMLLSNRASLASPAGSASLYAPPAAPLDRPSENIVRDGPSIVVPLEVTLPRRCLVCNDANVESPREFRASGRPRWLNRASMVGVAVGWVLLLAAGMAGAPGLAMVGQVVFLIALISLAVRRRVSVTASECIRHRRIRVAIRSIGLGIVAMSFVPLILFRTLGATMSPGWVLIGPAAFFLFALIASVLYSRPRVAYIVGNRAWLRGLGERFVESIPVDETARSREH